MTPRTDRKISKQNTNFQGKAAARIPLLALALLAAPLLASCGESASRPERERVDPRPRWTVGATLRVREESERRSGTGRFPAAGELVERTRSIESGLTVFEDTVLEARDSRLFRVRRTYVRSYRTRKGKEEPTVLSGKTYEITDPFADDTFRLAVLGPDGEKTAPSREEERLVRVGLLRMAASLLPPGPVRGGETWRPGRPTSDLGIAGGGEVRMTARLLPLPELAAGQGHATVECEMDLESPEGINISMRESVVVDLEAGLITSYRGLTEYYNSPGLRRPEIWRRISATLTAAPAE